MTQTSTSEHPTRNTLDLANEKQKKKKKICFYVFNTTCLFVFFFFFLFFFPFSHGESWSILFPMSIF